MLLIFRVFSTANLSQDSSNLAETSILSLTTDEGLDVSQRFTDSIFTGPDLETEGEEIVTGGNISSAFGYFISETVDITRCISNCLFKR